MPSSLHFRIAISIILLTAGTSAYAVEANAPKSADAAKSEELKIAHGPCLQGPRETSMTVVWFTNKPCVSWVEYGQGDGPLESKATSAHHGLIDADTTRHAVTIEGLKPGQTYRYRVVSREMLVFDAYKAVFGKTVASEPRSFTTCDADKKAFSFCVVSDIHERAKELDELLKKVNLRGVDLVFLNGDMTDHLTRESQVFRGFWDLCVERFAETTPMIWVRGNHETRGPLARRFTDYFATPEARLYYSFNHGGVHFIVLDSGEDKEDSHKAYNGLVAFDPYRKAEGEWLRRDLESEACRKARYRVAVVHMPPMNDKGWRGAQHAWKTWSSSLNEGGVDLVLSGHTHKTRYTPPIDGANCYPLLTGSNNAIIQADVTRSRLSIRVTEIDGRASASFDVLPRGEK